MKKCFTLAEVLITLSILGIVAAISIPNLIQNYKEKTTITRLKKAYSYLQNAYDMAVAIHGPYLTWFDMSNMDSSANSVRNSRVFNYLLKEQFQYAKECGFSDDGCFALNKCKGLGGGSIDIPNPCTNKTWIWDNNGTWRRILLKDGIAIGVQGRRNDSNFGQMRDGALIYDKVSVDINGPKAPNEMGKDIFMFALTDKGIYPKGGPDYYEAGYWWTTNWNICKKGYPSHGCAYFALKNGNMSYLRGKY